MCSPIGAEDASIDGMYSSLLSKSGRHSESSKTKLRGCKTSSKKE
jgi:hypothetical protein